MTQSHKDKVVRLEAEIDELFTELDQQTDAKSNLTTDMLAGVANQALSKQVAEDLKVKQGREIR